MYHDNMECKPLFVNLHHSSPIPEPMANKIALRQQKYLHVNSKCYLTPLTTDLKRQCACPDREAWRLMSNLFSYNISRLYGLQKTLQLRNTLKSRIKIPMRGSIITICSGHKCCRGADML